MKHLLPTALAFLLVVGCGPDEKTQLLLDTMDKRIVTLENAQTNDNSRLDRTEQRIDTVESGLLFVGNVVMKHDSIVADKQWKRDRAERRGAFWGNLIKTIVK